MDCRFGPVQPSGVGGLLIWAVVSLRGEMSLLKTLLYPQLSIFHSIYYCDDTLARWSLQVVRLIYTFNYCFPLVLISSATIVCHILNLYLHLYMSVWSNRTTAPLGTQAMFSVVFLGN